MEEEGDCGAKGAEEDLWNEGKLNDFCNSLLVYKLCGVEMKCNTDQGNIFFYVGTVWKICKNGVHVLDISDANSQVCQPGQRPQFILILKKTNTYDCQSIFALICIGH